MNDSTVTETDLQAWLDDRLPPARRAEVDAWLAGHPEETVRLQAYRDADARLRMLFQPVLDEPLPQALVAAAQQRRPQWSRYAASVLLALTCMAAGWFAHDAMQATLLARAPDMSGLIRQAATAHAVFTPEVRHPVEVGADQQAHLATWLSKRLGARLALPQLESLGYTLVGGRLLPGRTGAVAQLMYRDASGKRLTLYLSPEYLQRGGRSGRPRETSFAFTRENGLNVLYWSDERFGCVLSGDLPQQELMRVGHAAYEQMDES